MVDPLLVFLALLHGLVLFGGAAWALNRLGLRRQDLPLGVVIAVWTALVLGAHGASLVGALDSLAIYSLATLAGLGLYVGLCRASATEKAPVALVQPPNLDFVSIQNPRVRKWLFWLLLGTLGLVTLCSIAIGTGVYPDNADSMIYRLPRAFWYVSHGSFMHPFESVDKRLTFYPLNGISLYVPLVLYNLPGNTFPLPSLLLWASVVYAAYRFARSLGADRLVALFASWIVATTPSILAQATSTNDELLAAASILFALYFGYRWLLTGSRLCLFLGITSAGLSVGTKMHVVYLGPILAVAFALAARYAMKNKGTWSRWRASMGGRTLELGALMLFVTIVPFFLYNYASTGRFYFFEEFVGDVFNLGASLRGAGQNLLIYLSQMVLAPIADLNFWPVANTRQQFNTSLNAIFNPMIAPFLDPDPKYYHMHYRFVGITIPVSVRFVEFSLWSGFVWLLWPLQARLAWRAQHSLRVIFFLIALTPPLWLLMWSISTLYMEGTATYFSYFLICATPAAAFAFLNTKRVWTNEIRWFTIVFVMATNLLIANNLLMYSGFRALPDLFLSRTWPYDWDLADQSVIDEIRKADRIRIAQTHDKMPYFAYMHWHPRAKYYTPFPVKELPEANKILQVLPISSLYEYGFMPIKVPEKRTIGMTYIGTVRAIGREAIFAAGNNVSSRWPGESNYILLQAAAFMDPAKRKWVLRIPSEIPGFSKADNIELRYEIQIDNEIIHTTDWQTSPGLDYELKMDPTKHRLAITTTVRAGWNHKELTRATYRINGPGAWLPDEREY